MKFWFGSLLAICILASSSFAADKKSDAKPKAAKAPVEGEGSGLDTTGPKNGKRVKYTCPCCRLNAWARHHARLICGGDNTPMAPVRTKT